MIQVKICGLMNSKDVDLCVLAGVHMLGFVVEYPLPVPWSLTRDEARKLIDKVPSFVSTCVVTGGTIEKILAIANATHPDIIQLHYQETLAEVDEAAHQLTRMGVKTVKALRLDSNGRCDFEIPDPVLAVRALSKTPISALLIDSYTDTRPGGTGVTVDLSTYKNIRQATDLPVILAGGLNPANIQSIIQETNPYAIDVLTGSEASPGHKDGEKIRRLVNSGRASCPII